MSKTRKVPNDLFITVVQSESDPEVLSVRMWSASKGKLCGHALKLGLLEAGFKAGDTARISFTGLTAEMVDLE